MKWNKLLTVLSCTSLFWACAELEIEGVSGGEDEISSSSEMESGDSEKSSSSQKSEFSLSKSSSSKKDSGKEVGMSSSSVKSTSSSSALRDDAKSSSSAIPKEWSWEVPQSARLNPEIKYDTMIDPRDNHVYKIVKIAPEGKNYSQVWMAENLNYADSVKTPSLKGSNWCYNDDEKNCKVGGRYYTWAAAIDSVALANDPKEPLNCGYGRTCALNHGIQGICPDGWHLPTIDEWGKLSVALGNAGVAGDSLKALTGWNYAGTADNNGTDKYGFTALPTGRRISATRWEKVGSDVYFWSSTEQNASDARYSNINNIYTKFYIYQNYKYYGQSVRCVKGEPVAASSSSSSAKSSSSSAVSSSNSEESSSSSAVSSSSEAESSSSLIASKNWDWDIPKEDYFNPNIKYDTMIDPRDKQVYRIVKIAPEGKDYSQVWMAENLNYADTAQMPILKKQSWCYHDDEKYCKVSGRYYTWMAAIDSAALAADTANPLVCGYGKECGLARSVQGVCPDGWHLPTRHELGKLIVALGNSEIAGRNLKSLSGWGPSAEGRGIDAYGFTALPVGRRLESGSYQKVSTDNYFWSTSEYTEYEAEYMNMNNIYTKAYMYRGSKYNGQNVRCVKN